MNPAKSPQSLLPFLWLDSNYTMDDLGRSEVLTRNEDLLLALNNEKIHQYAGLTAYVACVAILGILGNICALVFYVKQRKQTATTILIIALTINDLLTSVFIFSNIYDFFHTLTFPSNVWCKLYYLVIHIFVVNSLLFLSAIGFERFVHIYHLPNWTKVLCQMSSSKYIISSCVFISAVFALRDIWLLELTPVGIHVIGFNRTITGFHCMHSRKSSLMGTIVVFHILDLCVLVFITLLLILIYSLIARKVATVRKNLDNYSKRSSLQIPHDFENECGQQNSINLSEATTDGSQQVEATETVHVTSLSSADDHTITRTSKGTQSVNTQLRSLKRRKSKTRMETRITVMMFAMTAASLLSFVPYFVISFLQTYDHTSSAWEVLAHRSYVMNSTVNPFIIGFFNSDFRRFLMGCFICFGRRIRNT